MGIDTTNGFDTYELYVYDFQCTDYLCIYDDGQTISIGKCYDIHSALFVRYLLRFYMAKHGDLLFDSSVQWSGTTTNDLPR